MSKKIFFYLALLSLTAIFSCSKKDNKTVSTLAETPIAKAQYDASNYGIYKGVFVGSSGTIIIDISNTSAITATLKIGTTTYNFTTTQTITLNTASTIAFTSGSNSFTFSVDASGANPTITNLIIAGHPEAILLVVKETSTALVKCFEGTYSGSDAGTFNAVIYNNIFKALVKSTTTAGFDATADGAVVSNVISAGSVSTGETFTGTLTGNDFSGTWNNSLSGDNGTWNGTRTY